MKKHTSNIAGSKIVAICSDEFTPQVTWLLGVILQMNSRGTVLADGFRFQLGWSILTLRRKSDGSLIICEPDYLNNPFEDALESVNITLDIQAKQKEFSRKYAVTPMITSFQDKIVVENDALAEDEIYMERSVPSPEKNDSGWYIGRRKKNDAAPEIKAVFAYELLKLRPQLFASLILPAGYMVFINKEKIIEIFNSKNKSVLT